MPYIRRDLRSRLDNREYVPAIEGELNYCITKMVNKYIQNTGGVSYQRINEVIGVLECAKLELYRRVAAPYEDKKMVENGDVYDCL